MSTKALVLSSGGVDSTTCVGLAVKKLGKDNVCTVSIYYGQKHNKELQCAKDIAEYYEVKHYEFDISSLFKFSNCALLQHSTQNIQHCSYAEQITEDNGMVSTYVPFRNGLMLSSIASLAMSLYPDETVDIYIGNHSDDYANNAYADCSPEFIKHISDAIYTGTYGKVKVVSAFVGMNKSAIVKLGLQLGVPYELTWSCYEGGDKQCGTCGTCIDRKLAFENNGVVDPVPYKE